MRGRIGGIICVLGLGLAWPVAVSGQQAVEERILALQWIRGEYRAPLFCELEGHHVQALRRVLVRPGPRELGRPLAQLTFYDLDAPPATPCTAIDGNAAPNILGNLLLHSDARTAEDTGLHDFKTTLDRDGGYTFRIEKGRLKLLPTDAVEADGRIVDFEGGSARFQSVGPGSDAFRRLSDFGGRRKLTLELEADDGTRLSFDLVQFDVR